MIYLDCGKIEKGYHKNGLFNGTWILYYPAKFGEPHLWCKVEYCKGEKVSK